MEILNILWLAFFCWTVSCYSIKERRMASGETFEPIFSLTPSHVGFPTSLFSSVSLSLSLSSIHLTPNCLLCSNVPALTSILSLCPCYLVLPFFLLFFSPFFSLLFYVSYPLSFPPRGVFSSPSSLSLYRKFSPQLSHLCPCPCHPYNKWVSECLSVNTYVYLQHKAKLWISTPVFIPLISKAHLQQSSCSAKINLHTQTHSYPGIHSLRRIGGCTCIHSHRHWLTPIPIAVCAYKPRQRCVCSITDEVYFYCRVIHDSLSWCWTLSK